MFGLAGETHDMDKSHHIIFKFVNIAAMSTPTWKLH